VVVGGGNTAMDAVRVARRLGADPATLVYRRSRAEMPARIEEVRHAEEEGVAFEMLADPVAILGDGDGWVRAVRCIRMQLANRMRRDGESHSRSRAAIRHPCEVVVVAVGTRANPLLTQTTPDLKTNSRGYIEIDADGMTSKPASLRAATSSAARRPSFSPWATASAPPLRSTDTSQRKRTEASHERTNRKPLRPPG
jgi:glutamate synthase (NADPH/NADH) small chain